MSYRDDRDALLARNKALEQENERLRRQIATQQPRREELPRHGTNGVARSLGRGLRTVGRGLWGLGKRVRHVRGGLAITVLLFGGIVAVARCDAVAKLFRPRISITRALIVETARGPVVSVLASYSRSSRGGSRTWYELSSFEARSGKELGVLEIEPSRGNPTPPSLFKPVGDRIWARHADGKLALLDLSGPSVELSRGALIARVPELAGGYQVRHDRVDEYSPPTQAVRVALRDGRIGWVDMTPAFATSPPPTSSAPAEPPPPNYYCDPDDRAKPSCLRTECIGFVWLRGTTASALASAPIWGQPRDRGVPIAEGASPLLRPGLVGLLETKCAFETDDSVLVLHDSAALDPKETLLSLVERATGQIRWTRPFAELTDRPRSKALGARIIDGEIVLLLHDNRATLDLVRLSLAGEVLARHRLL